MISTEKNKKKIGYTIVYESTDSMLPNPIYTEYWVYKCGCVYVMYHGSGGVDTQNVETYWTDKDKNKRDESATTEITTEVEVNDSDWKRAAAKQGGKLLEPVVDLLLTIGDGIMDVIQQAVVGVDGHISLDIKGLSTFFKIIGIIVGIAVIVGLTVLTGGIATFLSSLSIGGAFLSTIGSIGIVSTVINLGILVGGVLAGHAVADGLAGAFLPDITVLPTYSVSPEEIFEGKLVLFDINFFNPKVVESTKDENGKEYYYYMDGNEKVVTSKQNTAMQLSAVIKKWYYLIRNIALVFMVLILVYIGIRIMFSSIASDKSKYKRMLGDWVISMLLVFVLQYIMVFAVNINESIVKLIGNAAKGQSVEIISLANMDNKKEFIKAVYETLGDDVNEYWLDSNRKSCKTTIRSYKRGK